MKKKILSFILCAVMLFQLLPAGLITLPVSAAEVPIDYSNLTQKEPMVLTDGTHTLQDVTITGGYMQQSAILINGDVTLIIEGTVVLTGADASGLSGGGAGIEVPAGSSLTLKGSGTLVATGGAAGNGTTPGEPMIEYHDDGSYSELREPSSGGAGAGAGIGTRGASVNPFYHGLSTSSPGSITIADENLLVQATGGAGGTGGTGGHGGTFTYIDRVTRWWGIPVLLGEQFFTDLVVVGGIGGTGGGGGGYPGAGIGAGGASGGAGGYGGSGGIDKNTIDGGCIMIAPISERVHYSAGGGGGGGGGQGYESGGGGGGGAAFCDTLYQSTDTGGTFSAIGIPIRSDKKSSHDYSIVVPKPKKGSDPNDPNPDTYLDIAPLGDTHQNHKNNENCACASAGGASNQDGFTSFCKCGKTSDGNGGISDGAGGEGGEGRHSVSKPESGDAGFSAGKKASGGTVTLQAGTLRANSGGDSAMDIGHGGGIGTAKAGQMYIRGGAMDECDSPAPTNGQTPVYPVLIRPISYVDSFETRTNVTVNGEAWGVTRFIPGRADGQLTIWLPNGSYTAAVADEAGMFTCKYKTFSVNGMGVSPTASGTVRLDVSAGNIAFNQNSVVQGTDTYAYTDDLTLYSSTDTANAVSFAENGGAKTVTLQNVHITTMTVNAGNTVTLVSEGTENTITTLDNHDTDSADVIFEGDVTSVLTVGEIDNRGENIQGYAPSNLYYVSDIAVAAADSYDAAKKQLTDNGYTYILDCDMNKDAGGKDIFVGYKITRSSKDAIYGLVTMDRWEDTNVLDGVTYHRVKNLSGNGDLNEDAGGADILLYYAKASDYPSGKKPAKPITCIQVFSDTTEAKTMAQADPAIWTEHVVGYGESLDVLYNGNPMNMNRGAGGDYYVYIYINRTFDEDFYTTREDYRYNLDAPRVTLIPTGQSYQRAGDITMNSFGTVKIGTILAHENGASVVYDWYKYHLEDVPIYEQKTFATATDEGRWGTSNLTVNRGRMMIDTFLSLQPFEHYLGKQHIDRGPVTQVPLFLAEKFPYLPYEFATQSYIVLYQQATHWRTFGNNNLGSVTVNGGTLQLGDGTGIFPDGTDNGFANDIQVTVKPGANLLSGHPLGTPLEITGLPANEHFTLIPDTVDGSMLGDYTSALDIWTNDNGNFITDMAQNDIYLPELIFVDSDGNAYRYEVRVRNTGCEATLKTLWAHEGGGSQYSLRIHPKYLVQGREIYAHTEGEYVYVANQQGSILLADGVEAELHLSGGTIPSISGDGLLTLETGNSVTVTDSITVPKLTFVEGAMTVNGSITGDITIFGGSIKTAAPILGAMNGEAPVYQAIIPVWANSFTVDGEPYIMGGSGHGDGKAYIYVPADTKFVRAYSQTFYLTFNEQTQTMNVSSPIAGDGYIDLSQGSAEILSPYEYFYKGQYYEKSHMGYTVTGMSDVNTLTVSGTSGTITLNGVHLTGQSIEIASGVNATVQLVGENSITAQGGMPAIHVPAGSSVRITGSGKLNAKGGTGAPAIGGRIGEVNGSVIIEGGMLDLIGGDTHAIGAGDGAETPTGSITILGGSVKTGDVYTGDSLGTVPVKNNQVLSRVVMTADATGDVYVDGKPYNVTVTDPNSRLYLYVVSGKHTVTIGNIQRQVAPINVADTVNGTIRLRLIDGDTEVKLSDGDMVVEGSLIRVTATPNEGYGQISGPVSGDYVLTRDGDELILRTKDSFGTFMADGWISIQADDSEKITGFSKELNNDHSTAQMGVSNPGYASVSFEATGAGITAEILVNGETVKSVMLTDNPQSVVYDWQSEGNEKVEIRFSGTGTVTLTAAILTELADSTSIKAEFAPVATLTLIQPDSDNSAIIAYDANGMFLQDRNPAQHGTQVIAGTEITLDFYAGRGTIFKGYHIIPEDDADDGTKITEQKYSFVLNNDMTVLVLTEWAEYHIAVTAPVFDPIKYGDDAPAAKEIILEDRGNVPAEIESITLSGDSADSFMLTTSNPLSLTGNTIKPKDNLNAGTYTALITVAYNDGKSTTVEVSFTVQKSESQIETAVIDAVYGEKIVLKAVVGIAGTELHTATPVQGQVTFYCGNIELGTAGVVNGVASLEYDTADRKLLIGENIITVLYGGSDNQNGATADCITVNLDPKEISAKITPNGGVYNGVITPATVTYDEDALVGEDTLDIKLIYTGKANDGSIVDGASTPTLAGNYTVTASIADNYYKLVGTLTDTFRVEKAEYDMSSAKWDYSDAFDYDGKEKSVMVIGLPTELTVNGYEGNKATAVGDYTAKVTFSYDGNNYNAPSLDDLAWSIKNDWTPTEYIVSAPNANDWLSDSFTITPANGYKISTTDTSDGVWENVLIYSAETADGSITFYLRSDDDGKISLGKTVAYKLDKTAPSGKVEFVERTGWEEFVHNISFGLFYKDEVTVKVTADDDLSGVASVEYYASDKAMTLDEVKAITDWVSYSNSFGVCVEDTKQFVYVVRITDYAGNVSYVSTDGAEYDTSAPVVDGIESGKTYYTTQKVVISDRNIASITLNGENAEATITLGGNKDAAYTIVVSDKAGNITTVTVTMKPISALSAPIDTLSKDNVKSSDEQSVDNVKEAVSAVDITNATEEEKAALKVVSEKVAELEKIIDNTKAEVARISEELNRHNEATVNSDDSATLEQTIADIDALLGTKNLTEDERKTLEDAKEKANDLLTIIKAVTDAINTENIKRVNDVTAENVTPDDKTDLQNAKEDLEKALDDYSGNYTEDEKQAIKDNIKRIDDALKVIENVEAAEDKINKLPEDITKDDTDDVDAAKKAYDELSDYEKSLIDPEAKKKLDAAIKAAEKANEVAGPDSPQTGDNSNIPGLFALMFGSLAVMFVIIFGMRRKKKSEDK